MMASRSTLRTAGLMLLLILIPLSVWAAGGKKKNEKPPEQFCRVSFIILRYSSGSPIKNASIVVHAVNKSGEQASDGFQLKTDTDGRTFMDDLPYGLYRVQVIVPRMQTWGDDLTLNQPTQEFTIRIKPPAGQLSIYDDK